MLIVPAILTNDVRSLETQIKRLIPYFSLFQIDVQDGLYVPSTTLPLNEIGQVICKIQKDVGDKYGRIYFDFHLMLSDYSGASCEVVRMSKCVNIRHVLVHSNIPEETEILSLCPSINPEEKYLQHNKNPIFHGDKLASYPAIQIMTVKPGPQGQSLDVDSLEKVKILRKMKYKGEILIDGSVNPESIKVILNKPKSYWPSTVCIGSYISRAPKGELKTRIKHLKKLIG